MRREPPIEAKLTVLLADEVDHGQVRLAFGTAKAAAELLREDGRALRGPQEQDGVDARHVDTLAEDVDGETTRSSPAASRRERRRARLGVAPDDATACRPASLNFRAM